MKAKQRGFTLIELLITVAISGTLIAGIGQILLQSKQTYKTQQALSHMMEDGRYILETLSKETRRMGYLRNKTASETSLGTAVGNLDYLFVLDNGGDGGGVFGSGVTLKKGEYIHGDYNRYSFDGSPNNVNKLVFRYQLNDACDLGSFGNCSNTSSNSSPCTRDIQLDEGEDPAIDRHIVTIYFYVAVDRSNIPVLYCQAKRDIITRIILDPSNPLDDLWLATTAKSSDPKPLLSNVERLLIVYGIDTDHDNATNVYKRADDLLVTDCGLESDGVTPESCWKYVMTVKFYVVLRSEESNLTKSDSSYLVDGQLDETGGPDIPSQRRLYRVFSTTITPRIKTESLS